MKSLIGKEWRDAKDGKVIEVMNPATGELVDTVPSLSVEEVNEAVDYAEVAQKEWADIPVYQRCEIMMKFVKLVEDNKEELARLLSDETGKPIKEARNEIANISIGVPAYVEKVKQPTYAIAYGVFCAAVGIDMRRAMESFLYTNTSGKVVSCVKTIPLSQTQGQQILKECHKTFTEVLDRLESLTERELCRSTPGFDVRCMQHETLYSRLYMS